MAQDKQAAERLASELLRIGAVTLSPDQPFTWASGLKSPIYCDNRLTISYPEVRNFIADRFAAIIRETYPEAEAIAGIATGGIPHAAWTADKLGLPMLYIRGKAKGHGKGNQIEGALRPGQKVVLIEDLVSTGGSSLGAALAARDAGATVLAVLAIFSYRFDQAADAFAEAEIPLTALTDYPTLLDTALKLGKIDENERKLLQSWRENPENYGKSAQ